MRASRLSGWWRSSLPLGMGGALGRRARRDVRKRLERLRNLRVGEPEETVAACLLGEVRGTPPRPHEAAPAPRHRRKYFARLRAAVASGRAANRSLRSGRGRRSDRARGYLGVDASRDLERQLGQAARAAAAALAG